jgi:Leucine-rich repeat (LRR) protein
MFLALPTELFLLIRSYLVEFDISVYNDDIGELKRKESERSWRNLLTVSKQYSLIRKETMVWSLNKMTFIKYSENAQFRQYVNERMSNPSRQLLFSDSRRTECGIDTLYFMLELIRTSCIGCISIETTIHLTELPSSSGVQVLFLGNCQALKTIGDYPNLKTLQIDECRSLESVGNLEGLQNLLFVDLNSNPVRPLEQQLSQFPLEQIQKLWLSTITRSFFTLSSRFQDLKYLRIFQAESSRMNFPGELFPSLVELHLFNFYSVRLAGMIHLRNLQIDQTRIYQIYGTEEIYPQLESFSYTNFYEVSLNTDSFLPLLQNVKDLSLGILQTPLKSDFLDSMNRKVTSVTVPMNRQEITIPDRFFEKVELCDCTLSQSSSLSKVQFLELHNCSLITDIRPLKDIPRLRLERLTGVEDFSCLGSQRYLIIRHCKGLSNEAVQGFGNVFHLEITSCHNLTEVRNLNGKIEFLTLNFCHGLRSVELSNQEYCHVRIVRYDEHQLADFNILGTVYSLDFTLTKRWTKETIPRRYQYLNGEEKWEELQY